MQQRVGMTAATSASIWKNREYLKFFSSFTIGNIGDWFDFFALQIIFAHAFGASPLAISFLLVAYMAPMALFSGIAGVMADRFNKKYLLFLTDVVSGLLTLGLVFSNQLALSLVLVFLRSSIASLNAPAQQAALKYIATEDQLLAASGYNSAVFQLCKVLGPLLGAVIIAIYSPVFCLMINAVSFFVSALILLTLKKIIEVREVSEHKSHMWQQLKEAGHFIRKDTLLRLNLTIMACFAILMMMGFSQLVLLLKMLFPQNENILGIVLGISGIGSFITGAWLSQKKNIVNYAAYMSVGILFVALNYGALAIYQSSWGLYPLYVLSLIDGLGFGIVAVVYTYVQQKKTPHTHMGRVSGFATMVQGSVFALGSLLGGVIANWIGLRPMFLLVGIGSMLVLIFICRRHKDLQLLPESGQ